MSGNTNDRAYVVEVSEGVVETSRQGIDWWTYYVAIYKDSSRMTGLDTGCIVGGLVQVACDSSDDAHWLAEHMVNFGGLPQSAVKVKRVSAVVPA